MFIVTTGSLFYRLTFSLSGTSLRVPFSKAVWLIDPENPCPRRQARQDSEPRGMRLNTKFSCGKVSCHPPYRGAEPRQQNRAGSHCTSSAKTRLWVMSESTFDVTLLKCCTQAAYKVDDDDSEDFEPHPPVYAVLTDLPTFFISFLMTARLSRWIKRCTCPLRRGHIFSMEWPEVSFSLSMQNLSC